MSDALSDKCLTPSNPQFYWLEANCTIGAFGVDVKSMALPYLSIYYLSLIIFKNFSKFIFRSF